MIEALIKLANLLDEQGEKEEADILDKLLKQMVSENETAEDNAEDIGADQVLAQLSDVADQLDKAGVVEAANMIDEFIKNADNDVMKWKEEDKTTEQSKRYDSKYHHSVQIREPNKEHNSVDREGRKEHHVKTYQQTNVISLSARHCPDHIGVQLGRVAEGVYQCTLDGAIYNWEAGWTDYLGNKHSGGSVAAQTPNSSDYSAPHRIFDSREQS